MKASKTLASAVAAAAVVGAIGLAYAQTTPPATPADSTSPPAQAQGTTTSPSTMQTPPAMQTPAASSTDTAAVQVERPAQADRN